METLHQAWADGKAFWVLEQPQRPVAQEQAAALLVLGGDQNVDALEDEGDVLFSKLGQPKLLEGPGARVVLGDQRWPEPAILFFITEEGEGTEFGFGLHEEAHAIGLGSLVLEADVAHPVHEPDRKAQQEERPGEPAGREKRRRDQHGQDVSPKLIVMCHQDKAQPQKGQEPQQHRLRPQAGHPLFEKEQKKEGGGEGGEDPFAEDAVGEEGQVGPAELLEIVEDPVGAGDASQNGTEAVDGELAEGAFLDGRNDAEEEDCLLKEDSHAKGEEEEEQPSPEAPAVGAFVFKDEAEEDAEGKEEDGGAVDEGGEGVGHACPENGKEAVGFSSVDACEEGEGGEGEVDAMELNDAAIEEGAGGGGDQEGGEGGPLSLETEAEGGAEAEEDGEGHSQGGEGTSDDEEAEIRSPQEGGKPFE